MAIPKLEKSRSVILILLLVGLDQASKLFALSWLATSCNEGSAFGLPISGVLVTVVVLFLVGIFFIRNKSVDNNLPYVLIMAGGVANLIDRLNRGCVLDFIDLKVWPSFNLADSAIVVGAALLTINLLRSKNHEA